MDFVLIFFTMADVHKTFKKITAKNQFTTDTAPHRRDRPYQFIRSGETNGIKCTNGEIEREFTAILSINLLSSTCPFVLLSLPIWRIIFRIASIILDFKNNVICCYISNIK